MRPRSARWWSGSSRRCSVEWPRPGLEADRRGAGRLLPSYREPGPGGLGVRDACGADRSDLEAVATDPEPALVGGRARLPLVVAVEAALERRAGDRGGELHLDQDLGAGRP